MSTLNAAGLINPTETPSAQDEQATQNAVATALVEKQIVALTAQYEATNFPTPMPQPTFTGIVEGQSGDFSEL